MLEFAYTIPGFHCFSGIASAAMFTQDQIRPCSLVVMLEKEKMTNYILPIKNLGCFPEIDN